MTSEEVQTIDSLPKLIERLRDPDGSSFLYLRQSELESITVYDGVDDFSETFSKFLVAVKANTSVTKVEIYGFVQAKKGAIFPIINPLLKHLPNLNEATFHVFSDLPVERFLFNNSASVTTVFILHHQPSDEQNLELHPTLDTIEYSNTQFACANAVIGPALLSLPFPSTIRELGFSHGGSVQWNDEMARPFTSPELNRLVEMIQLSSLMKLKLEDVRFSSLEECSQFAQGLRASVVKDLSILLYSPDAGNYREIVSALSKMQHLESLEAIFALDDWREDAETLGSFSIPVGSIVRGVPGLKKLKTGQGWKHWDDVQCRDLAMAIQSPSCGLKVLCMDYCITETTIAGAAAIMSTFSAPSSMIEEFSCKIAPFEVEEVDTWLSMLPRRTMLRSLAIYGDGEKLPALTELQEEKFLRIVSGWYYLTEIISHYEGEAFVDCCLGEDCGEQLLTLMRLNKSGRHYLTSPTRSKADGVEVLIKVRDELDDIFTHLLENPCLCDRGVETSARRDVSPVRKKSRLSSYNDT